MHDDCAAVQPLFYQVTCVAGAVREWNQIAVPLHRKGCRTVPGGEAI